MKIFYVYFQKAKKKIPYYLEGSNYTNETCFYENNRN